MTGSVDDTDEVVEMSGRRFRKSVFGERVFETLKKRAAVLDRLDFLAKQYARANDVTYHKGYAEVLHTAEGRKLYAEHEACQAVYSRVDLSRTEPGKQRNDASDKARTDELGKAAAQAATAESAYNVRPDGKGGITTGRPPAQPTRNERATSGDGQDDAEGKKAK